MAPDLTAPAIDQPVGDTAAHLLVIDDDSRIRT
ncbi:MAG: DNA-binding response regulator, partial [Bauldia sp.]